ncbi:MAG: histidine kinase N-terminal 7TM domain-containing protein [Deltaproteobacteria bacterium]
MGIKIYIFLLCISIFCLLLLGFYILKMKTKKQINYIFSLLVLSAVICNIGFMIAILYGAFWGDNNIKLSFISFLGQTFIPVAFLFVGVIFAKSKIKFNYKYLAFLVIPILSNVLIWTNDYHRLFFKEYSSFADINFGSYFYFIFLPWNYGCIIFGLYYLIKFSIKNSGFFSKQALLIVLGSVIPFITNILWTIGNSINNYSLKLYSVYDPYPVLFAFPIICLAFAIFKFDFLNIVPVALQNVVDQISDSYVIINEELEVIDYNKTFVDIFSEIFQIRRKETLASILKPEGKSNNFDLDKLVESIKEAIKEKKAVSFESQIISGEFDKFFTVEITPIIKKDNHLGTIILLKDITQHKKDMELVQQTQGQLMQRDRLASLGELAGGVAHDINSPLSVIQGGLMFVERLFIKYRDSLNDESITPEKRKEMEEELLHQIANSSNASQKIVKIVNSIRNHTRNLSGENIQDFYVSTVFEDIKILLNHQLKGAGCEIEIEAEDKTLVTGDTGKLGQVITNLVVNAIQAYNGVPGKILLKSRKEEDNIIIVVQDFAGGIPETYREGIFSKMLTTKGTQGTGLGLYLSYSIITGHFSGSMWFDTEEGKGTEFYISIPIKKVKKEN